MLRRFLPTWAFPSMNPTGCLDHVGVSYPGFDLCDTLLRRGRSGATTRMEMGYFPFFLFLTLLKLNLIVIVLHLSLTSSTLSLWRDILNCQTWNRQSILMETLMRIHYICYIFISSMFPLNTIHALNVTCCKILWPVEEMSAKDSFPCQGGRRI